MKRISRFLAFLLGFLLVILPISTNWVMPGVAQSKPAQRPNAEVDRSQLRPFDEVIKDTKPLKGLFTLYQNEKIGRVLLEISPNQLDRNFFAAMTLETGVGERGIYSGLPLGDFLFTFRRVNNSIQFVVPNFYFRADQGIPIERSIQRSFSDSVLETLPIRSIHAERKSFLVELNPLLLSDLPGLMPFLSASLQGSYNLESGNSYFDRIKAFPENIEVESVFAFSGSGNGDNFPTYIETLPDSRAFSLKVRYSLSQLPENNSYRPRLADDRIGYFITAYKDYTTDTSRRPFVRYINRWNLQKKDPNAPLSEPVKPIVFWIENSVPLEYRDAVREGALLWNRAFEKIGFKNAIEVKQMPDKADWDPADVRYNTIRWFNTNDAIFAMGPSRVNPLTGEILDADIIVSADFARAMKEDYRTLVEQNQMRSAPFVAQLTSNPNLCSYGMAAQAIRKQAKTDAKKQAPRLRFGSHLGNYQDLCFGVDTAKQFAVGNMSLSLMQNVLPSSPEMKAFAQEFMRNLIAHEVGHTLGLRHNFRSSAMLKPEELNNTAITQSKGLTGSVMDYAPVNLAPQGTKQGDYFSHTIGPYDEWAIEYGYTLLDARVPQAERRELDKIAQRAPQPELTYATDEDLTYLDPKTNVFDMSDDLLTYSEWQLKNAREMWNRVDQRFPFQGDSFNEVRVAFNSVFDYYFQFSTFLSEYIGGQYFNRFKAGDAQGRLPFESVPIDQQRRALALIQQYVFSEDPFRFSPDFLNKLAPSRWSHWGTEPTSNLDYPIHDNILFLQSFVLYSLLDYDRLARLRDSELRTQAGQGMTIPDLFDTLQSSIWGDVIKPQDNLKLSGLRRALQRQYMEAMIAMMLRQADAPDDARTVARYELKQLHQAIDRAMRRVNEKEIYTKAHLEEARDRIAKALDAQLQSQ
ncbi:zinc-dependent metalloprotease [Leptolyngbya sp. NIES-2104]|uniref:zinc-dependent metalloprotease n=1 Tax=Leptolyngbya sp. NIES-2104 TaxID=1552121 RepID=UPI000A7C826B|nr:zinc-dependent metalloprotease [Leptolyngbya sp. NIES-2104]